MVGLYRLLALFAVLLMPLGMQPAVAATTVHHAAMPMRHCPEPAPSHNAKGGFAECTMACSAGLPAADLANGQPLPVASAPTDTEAADILNGLHPSPATPPPRRA